MVRTAVLAFLLGILSLSHLEATELFQAVEPKAAVEVNLPAKMMVTFGSATQPTVVKSEADLEKVLSDKQTREELAKTVDFSRNELLIFAWRGSGMDRVTLVDNAKGPDVEFRYTRGRTRDLRQHIKGFAVAKGTKWKVN